MKRVRRTKKFPKYKDYKSAGFNDLFERSPYDSDSRATNKNTLASYDVKAFDNAVNLSFAALEGKPYVMQSGVTTLDIFHNLGYPPAFMASFKSTATGLSNRGWLTIPFYENDGIANPQVLASVDENKISFFRSFSTGTVTIYYYLLQHDLDGSRQS